MKLWIMSDLHQGMPEDHFRPDEIPNHDVLVLAGINGSWMSQTQFYACQLADKPIVAVAGPREFFGQCIDDELAAIEEQSDPQFNQDLLELVLGSFEEGEKSDNGSSSNVRFLENTTCEINGFRITGCTLWTDYELYEGRREDAMVPADMFMNDHRMIKTQFAQGAHGKRRFLQRDALARHRQSTDYLTATLAKPFAGPTIVVTHHAPHPKSVAPQYKNDPLTAAFVSNLSGLIEKYQPALWVHSHTHTAFDYHIGHTLVVCNPFGYSREQTGFVEDLVMKV